MQDKRPGPESKVAGAERRASQRVRISSLVYVDLGQGNGGIATWLSEHGLALTAAGDLAESQQGGERLKMRIQLPGCPAGVEVNGQIAWKSNSGKKAGVRFVDLDANTREEIRNWISSQVPNTASQPYSRGLPKMRLPTSDAANGRGSRGPKFSFSDVASSRVDGDDTASDFPNADSEFQAAPSQNLESMTFADGAKAVASAFESAAFTEEPKVEAHAAPDNPPTQATKDEARQTGQPSSILERRVHARRSILLFTYAALGEDNGGLVFNLSEGGLALTAAGALGDQQFARMRVRFPDSEDSIETSGQLAWMSDSGKEAGIEFVNVPEDVRARIREWVALGEPAADLRRHVEVPSDQNQKTQTPSVFRPQSPDSEFPKPTASFEERINVPVSPRPALLASGIKGALARASIRKRVAKIKPGPLPERAIKRSGHVARNALAAAALVTLCVAGWSFLQHNTVHEASGVVAQNGPAPAISSEPKPETQVAVGNPTANPPVQPMENVNPQNDATKSSDPNTGSTADSGAKENIDNDKGMDEKRVTDIPALNSAPHEPDRKERKTTRPPHEPARKERNETPPRRAQKPKAPPRVVPVPARLPENKPVENKPVLSAEVLPTQSPTLSKDLNVALSAASPPPIRPEAAPKIETEKEKLLVAAKQPEAPVAPAALTPQVTVSFDPYPSIRMPKTENPKKSKQGKSLQMGHLVMRVDPLYPEEAKQRGVEGTVKVHAIFNREGAVESVTPVNGPPQLVPAAMSAVRQWRYSQTILGGQAMETEEDVTVQFRLSKGLSKN